MIAVFNKYEFISKTDKVAEENGIANGSSRVFICQDKEISDNLIHTLCNEIVRVANNLISQSDNKNFELKVQNRYLHAMVKYETPGFCYQETWDTIDVATIGTELNITFSTYADIEFAKQRAGTECYLSVFSK